MDPVKSAIINQASALPVICGETVEDCLKAIERNSGTPTLIADTEGTVIATSPNAGDTCAVIEGSGKPLMRVGDNLCCPVTDCPLHATFGAASLIGSGQLLEVVQCTGSASLSFSADLLAPAVRADVEQGSLIEELARQYEELHLMQRVAGAVEEHIDQLAPFVHIINGLRKVFPVEAAQVWSLDSRSKDYRCLLHQVDDQRQKNLETVMFDKTMVRSLKERGVRVIRSIEDDDPIETFLLQMADQLALPIVVIPLLAKSQVHGVLVLRFPDTITSIGSALLRLIEATARQLSSALHAHLLIEELRANEGLRKEIEIARQIQSNLLPQKIPESEHFDLYAGCVTATRVGGDYYDFFTDREHETGLLIADVSGHSVASGLIAMSFRSSFRQYRQQQLEMETLFCKVNEFLSAELNTAGHFLSAFFARYNENHGELRYVNAGHNYPVVLRQDGSFEELDSSGLLIGVIPDWQYDSDSVKLHSGDTLVLYTDGVVEAENQDKEQFGMDRFKEAIKKHSKLSAKLMYHMVLKELYVFQDENYNQDDVTLIVFKVK